MFCTSCGKQLPDGLKFCTSCGAPVAWAGLSAAGSAPAANTASGMDDIKSKSSMFKKEFARPAQPEPEPERTVVMPAAASAPQPEAPSYEGLYTMPDGAYAGEAAPEQARGGKGPVIAAIVLVLLAVLSVAAVVVVVADPFGLRLLDGGQAQQQAPAETTEPSTDASDPEGEGASEQGSEAEASPDADEQPEAWEPTCTVIDSGTDQPDAQSDSTNAQDGSESSSGDSSSSSSSSSSDSSSSSASSGTYILPDSDTHLYTESELSSYSNWELLIARNEIYARHGRQFVTTSIQDYFNTQPWYTPLYTPEEFDAQVGSFLNSIEQQNAATILSVEKARGSEYL